MTDFQISTALVASSASKRASPASKSCLAARSSTMEPRTGEPAGSTGFSWARAVSPSKVKIKTDKVIRIERILVGAPHEVPERGSSRGLAGHGVTAYFDKLFTVFSGELSVNNCYLGITYKWHGLCRSLRLCRGIVP